MSAVQFRDYWGRNPHTPHILLPQLLHATIQNAKKTHGDKDNCIFQKKSQGKNFGELIQKHEDKDNGIFLKKKLRETLELVSQWWPDCAQQDAVH